MKDTYLPGRLELRLRLEPLSLSPLSGLLNLIVAVDVVNVVAIAVVVVVVVDVICRQAGGGSSVSSRLELSRAIAAAIAVLTCQVA